MAPKMFKPQKVSNSPPPPTKSKAKKVTPRVSKSKSKPKLKTSTKTSDALFVPKFKFKVPLEFKASKSKKTKRKASKKIKTAAPDATGVTVAGSKAKFKVSLPINVPKSSKTKQKSSKTDTVKGSKSNPKSKKSLIESSLQTLHLDAILRCAGCGKGLVDDDPVAPGPQFMRDNFLRYQKAGELLQRQKLFGGDKSAYKWTGAAVVKKAGVKGGSEMGPVVASTNGQLFHHKCLVKTYAKDKSGPPLSDHYQVIDIEGQRARCKALLFGGRNPIDREMEEKRLLRVTLSYELEKELSQDRDLVNKIHKAKKRLNQVKGQLAVVNASKKAIATPTTTSGSGSESQVGRNYREETKRLQKQLNKSTQVIKFMGEQTIKIMRIYIQRFVSKIPVEDVVERTGIPRMLVPYLDQIGDCDHCLFSLSHILKPKAYPGMKFSVDELIISILNRVDRPLCEKLYRLTRKSGSPLFVAYEELFPDKKSKSSASENGRMVTIKKKVKKVKVNRKNHVGTTTEKEGDESDPDDPNLVESSIRELSPEEEEKMSLVSVPSSSRGRLSTSTGSSSSRSEHSEHSSRNYLLKLVAPMLQIIPSPRPPTQLEGSGSGSSHPSPIVSGYLSPHPRLEAAAGDKGHSLDEEGSSSITVSIPDQQRMITSTLPAPLPPGQNKSSESEGGDSQLSIETDERSRSWDNSAVSLLPPPAPAPSLQVTQSPPPRPHPPRQDKPPTIRQDKPKPPTKRPVLLWSDITQFSDIAKVGTGSPPSPLITLPPAPPGFEAQPPTPPPSRKYKPPSPPLPTPPGKGGDEEKLGFIHLGIPTVVNYGETRRSTSRSPWIPPLQAAAGRAAAQEIPLPPAMQFKGQGLLLPPLDQEGLNGNNEFEKQSQSSSVQEDQDLLDNANNNEEMIVGQNIPGEELPFIQPHPLEPREQSHLPGISVRIQPLGSERRRMIEARNNKIFAPIRDEDEGQPITKYGKKVTFTTPGSSSLECPEPLPPPTKEWMECETQTPKMVVRLPRDYFAMKKADAGADGSGSHDPAPHPSPKIRSQSQHYQLDANLIEFDPRAILKVQEKISQLCLKVDPPEDFSSATPTPLIRGGRAHFLPLPQPILKQHQRVLSLTSPEEMSLVSRKGSFGRLESQLSGGFDLFQGHQRQRSSKKTINEEEGGGGVDEGASEFESRALHGMKAYLKALSLKSAAAKKKAAAAALEDKTNANNYYDSDPGAQKDSVNDRRGRGPRHLNDPTAPNVIGIQQFNPGQQFNPYPNDFTFTTSGGQPHKVRTRQLSKSKSKGNKGAGRSLSGRRGNRGRNYIAENIAAAFKTPVREGITKSKEIRPHPPPPHPPKGKSRTKPHLNLENKGQNQSSQLG